MSSRPVDAVNEASRFSLRSVFSSAPAEKPSSPTPSGAPPEAAPFNLRLPAAAIEPAAAPAAPLNAAQLKFTLPTLSMKPQSAPVAARGDANKMLKAGYIAGGAGNSPEVMRLNTIVEDLQAKLKKVTDKLASAESSIARGNAALTSERATSHARIVALKGEVTAAQQREQSARVEMAAIPRASEFDEERFKLQAEGALQLQNKLDSETARLADMEQDLSKLTERYKALQEEHGKLETAHAIATDALELAQKSVSEELQLELQKHKDHASAATDALAEAERSTELAVETVVQKSMQDQKEMISAHNKAMEELQTKLDVALVDLETTQAASATDAEESTLIIEDLQSKLTAARAKRTEGAVLPPELQKERMTFETLRKEAETAVLALTGDSREADVTRAAKLRHDALRAYAAMKTGATPEPMVTGCNVQCRGNRSVRLHLAHHVKSIPYGTAMCAMEDCDIDLHNTSCCDYGTEFAREPTDVAEVSQQVRTSKLVEALSNDLKLQMANRTAMWATGKPLAVQIVEASSA